MQDTPVTPQVVHPGAPEMRPGLYPTTAGIATPVDLSMAPPGAAEATPALFPCATAVGGSITIKAVAINWNPKELTIPADTDVTIRVPNNGAIPHNFVIKALGINDQSAPPG